MQFPAIWDVWPQKPSAVLLLLLGEGLMLL